jgi:integrase
MATLRRKMAAIARASAAVGAQLDTKSPEIRQALRGFSAEYGEPARIAAALTIEDLRRLVAGCGEDLSGLRDRALLVVGFAGALRRSELVAIQHEHLVEVASGLKLFLVGRANAPGRYPSGEILMARAQPADICPVRVVRAWLAVSGIQEGPVFRKVGRGGVLGKRGLSADAVRQILLRCAARVGLKGSLQEPISPNGLRSGFVTSAYRRGIPEERIMAQAGHTSLATMRKYRRRAKLG